MTTNLVVSMPDKYNQWLQKRWIKISNRRYPHSIEDSLANYLVYDEEVLFLKICQVLGPA